MTTTTESTTAYNFGAGLVPAHQHPNGGGWVADTAYVAPVAYIGQNAMVYGSARVCDSAMVYDSADYLTLGPIGSRGATLTWTCSDGHIATGCFRGTIDEFEAAVTETHGDNEHGRAYRAAIAFIRAYAAETRPTESS